MYQNILTWQIPLIGGLILIYVFTPLLAKQLATGKYKIENFFLNYALVFFLIFPTAITLARGDLWSLNFLLFFLIGFINNQGTIFYWKAINLSLTKTALFTQLDDLITILVGFMLFHEKTFFTPLLFIGFLLTCIAGVSLLFIKERAEKNKTLLMYVGGYSVIWGLAFIAVRHFSVQDTNPWIFFSGWYAGSFVSAWLIMMRYRNKNKFSFTYGRIIRVAPLSFLTAISLVLYFWVSKFAPIVVIQPIIQTAETVFPAIIGLTFFHERMKKNELVFFTLGITGSILLILSL